MLKNIPSHIIGGPLGAGKTTLIRHLLTQQPPGQRWAVLINEFGAIGLDAALLDAGGAGIAVAEVAGGCICCVNGAPFQVGLTRLLRQARPQRLFIEPSGFGHPRQLLEQLRQPLWRDVLDLQPPVMVLDAAALAQGRALVPAQSAFLEHAALLVLNKVDEVDARQLESVRQALPPVSTVAVSGGRLDLAQLPLASNGGVTSEISSNALPQSPPPMGVLWADPSVPLRETRDDSEGSAIGWRFHPSQRFDRLHVRHWLEGAGCLRAKAVLHTEQGWLAINHLAGGAAGISPEWAASEWRRDSRLELLFTRPPSFEALEQGLLACRLP